MNIFRLSFRFAAILFSVTLAACTGPTDFTSEHNAPSSLHSPVSQSLPPTPEQLEHQSPAIVETLLGPPSMIRKETPAEVWQYGGNNCVLDIIFYPVATDDSTATPSPSPEKMVSQYLESRDMDGTRIETSACLMLLNTSR